MAEAFPELPNLETNVVTRTIKIRNFSKTKHEDKRRDEDIFYKCLFVKLIQIRIYPAGKGKENKDYVSVMIRKQWIKEYPLTYQCIVNVIDFKGNPQRPQSFGIKSLTESKVKDFGLEQYVSRQYLFDNASELLPSDTLTLQCEVSYTIELAQNPMAGELWNKLNLVCEMLPKTDTENENSSEKWIYVIETMEGERYPLKFENGKKTLGSDVFEASEVFKRMFETPMIEKFEKRVKLCDVDHNTLGYFLSYIERKNLVTRSVEETCKLYDMANRYMVKNLRRECSLNLVRSLAPDNTAEICALAHQYDDQQFLSDIALYFRTKQVLLVNISSNDEPKREDCETKNSSEFLSNERKADTKISKKDVRSKIIVLIDSLLDVSILHEIAIKHRLYELANNCIEYVKQNVKVEDINDILRFASRFGDAFLQTLAEFLTINESSLEELGHKEALEWLKNWNASRGISIAESKISDPEVSDSQSLEYDNTLGIDEFDFYQ